MHQRNTAKQRYASHSQEWTSEVLVAIDVGALRGCCTGQHVKSAWLIWLGADWLLATPCMGRGCHLNQDAGWLGPCEAKLSPRPWVLALPPALVGPDAFLSTLLPSFLRHGPPSTIKTLLLHECLTSLALP
jgi:hypothetical protein